MSDTQFEQFDAYLSEITKAYHIPGMVFFITDPEKTIFSRTYGQCNSMEQQFFIGSMSKSYTALCIMQLVEKGLIDLDKDISYYLPEYNFPKEITILALLNHTSGFDTHAKLYNVKLTNSYGKYEYANVNYDLLGKIIEKVSGLSYEDYVKKNIFEPFGMSDSNANAQKLKDSPELLTGNRNYFGFFKQGKADYPTEQSWFHEPAGYIASTPQDHAKYLRMYLNGGLTEQGTQIIKKETIDSMWYENVSLGSAEYEAFYGKGWNYMEYEDLKIVFHGGQVENGITYMFILPEKKLAVCFMINANDEFVMNSLMDNAFWNSLSIIKGTPVKKVHHASYIIRHIIFDMIYLLIFSLSLFILIRAITAKTTVLHILGCVIWPIFLLTFSKILIDTPLWVIKSFVPDFYYVILISSVLAITGGLVRTAKSLFFFKCYDK